MSKTWILAFVGPHLYTRAHFIYSFYSINDSTSRIISIVHPWHHDHEWTMENIQHIHHKLDKINRIIMTLLIV